jgi:thiamine biosynthesis protein ThiS
MEITLNGKPRQLAEPVTISGLLAALELPVEHVAVELNGELVERADFERRLAERDRLEVVRFVGGG